MACPDCGATGKSTGNGGQRSARFKTVTMKDPHTGEEYQGEVHDGYNVEKIEYCPECLLVFRSWTEKES
jgi:hypothetical protein